MHKFEIIVNIDDFFIKLGEVMNECELDNNEIMSHVKFKVNDLEDSNLKSLECEADAEEYQNIWIEAFNRHDRDAIITYHTKEEELIYELQEENRLLGQMITDMELTLLEIQMGILAMK